MTGMTMLTPRMLAALKSGVLRRVRRGWISHNASTKSGPYHLPATIDALEARGLVTREFDRVRPTKLGRRVLSEEPNG